MRSHKIALGLALIVVLASFGAGCGEKTSSESAFSTKRAGNLGNVREDDSDLDLGEDWITVDGSRRMGALEVVTEPYPGFPTDMQAQIMTACAVADGVSRITETIYFDRFTHVPELRRMGAKVRRDGNGAVVTGIDKLQGAPVMATDLRCSAALILAACGAEGKTELSRIYHIDRGYERIEEKLKALGAKIVREEEPH